MVGSSDSKAPPRQPLRRRDAVVDDDFLLGKEAGSQSAARRHVDEVLIRGTLDELVGLDEHVVARERVDQDVEPEGREGGL